MNKFLSLNSSYTIIVGQTETEMKFVEETKDNVYAFAEFRETLAKRITVVLINEADLDVKGSTVSARAGRHEVECYFPVNHKTGERDEKYYHYISLINKARRKAA
jgi:hypothetical protein